MLRACVRACVCVCVCVRACVRACARVCLAASRPQVPGERVMMSHSPGSRSLGHPARLCLNYFTYGSLPFLQHGCLVPETPLHFFILVLVLMALTLLLPKRNGVTV